MALLKKFYTFFHHLMNNRGLIVELIKRDFKQKYASNKFGLTWAIIEPFASIIVFWFIFSFGLRAGKHLEVPFITYMLPGYIAFLFFQISITQNCSSIRNFSYLIKQVNFRVSVIPLVKMISESIMHLIFLVITIVVLIFHGFHPNIFWLQLIYYFFSMFLFTLGLSLFISSTSLFFPDLSNILHIIIRIMFYLTPIFWNIFMLPKKFQTILKYNPMFYIVNGYRDSLLFSNPFWNEPILLIYFWSLVIVFLIVGTKVFTKLRPHFADVI